MKGGEEDLQVSAFVLDFYADYRLVLSITICFNRDRFEQSCDALCLETKPNASLQQQIFGNGEESMIENPTV